MPTPIRAIVEELDELVADATPPDGSAPEWPVAAIGNLIVQKWPTIRAAIVLEQSTIGSDAT